MSIVFETCFAATVMLMSLMACKGSKKKIATPPISEAKPVAPPAPLPAPDPPKQDDKTQEQTKEAGGDAEKKEGEAKAAEGMKKEGEGEKKEGEDEKKEGDKKKEGEGEKKSEKKEESKKEAGNKSAKKKDGEGGEKGADGVTVTPEELKWSDFPADQEITIKNVSGDRIAIKVKSSDNNLFTFDPAFAFVKEGESTTVKVNRTAGPPKPDKIEVVWATAEEEIKEAEEIFTKADVKQNVLVVKCIGKSVIPHSSEKVLEKGMGAFIEMKVIEKSKEGEEEKVVVKKEKKDEKDGGEGGEEA